MELVKLGSPLPLSAILEDGRSDQFIRAEILDRSGNILQTLSIPHIANGIYSRADILAISVGDFMLSLSVFRDSSFLIPSQRYGRILKTVRVENIENVLTETIDLGDGRIA